MITIDVYCKANKRKRNNESVSVCGHIIKEGEKCEEYAYTLESQANVVELEITALMNALLDMEGEERLNKETSLHIYMNNEYIVERLLNKIESKTLDKAMSDHDKYTEIWEEIDTMLDLCEDYQITGLDKKSRETCSEEITKNMGTLNKIVCNKINSCLRAE